MILIKEGWQSMNIYDYFCSRDLAAYCRKINKVWNTFEMAVIIARSNHPMAEKHKAWRGLIEHYHDMPAPRNWHQNHFDSIHKKLVEIIDYEERVLAMFKNPEPGALYKYSVWWGDSQVYSDGVFSDYEKTLADAKKSWEREEAPVIRIEKMFIDDGNKDKGQTVTVVDYDGNVQEIDFY